MAKNGKISFINSIGGKILIIFVSVSILAIGTLAVISAMASSKALKAAASHQLEAIGVLKSNQVRSLFNRILSDVEVVAGTQDVINSIESFILYHREMDFEDTDLYDMSSSAEGLTKTYDEIYSEANNLLKKYAEIYGYYDVFLICAKHGHVMYTWAKEADLGENLKSGQYRESGLAKIWRKALDEDGPAFVDTTAYAPSNGAPAMFAGTPIKNGNETIGVLVIQVSSDQINLVVQERTGMGESGETYLIGSDEDGTTSLRSDRVVKDGKILEKKSGSLITKCLEQGMSGIEVKTGSTGKQELVAYLSVELPGGINWGLFSTMSMDEIQKPVSILIIQITVVTIIILIVIIVIAIIFSRSITRPLKAGVEFANRIASKDLSIELDMKYAARKDEIGALSVSLSEMQDSIKGMMGEMNTGTSSLASASTELLSISNEMSKGAAMTTEKAGTVAAASEELNANANSVATGMEQSSANLESVASATEEMTATIKQIAQNTESARSITEQAVEQSKQVTELMDILGESANEIGKVTETIASISDQTNLLALNATIEAARAGAAGKGFAVVASEIKDLAKQTADATEDIKSKIEGIQSSTNNSIVDIRKITEIVQNVNDYVTTIASAVEEQSITTKDISVNMGQASAAVQDASERTAQNSTVSQDIAKEIAEVSLSADEMSGASHQVAESAKELSALSERLKSMVDTYKL